MHINSVTINNFRNFNETTVNFKEGVNVIIGPNNAGKTNLLKVISYLKNRPKLKLTDFNYNNLFDQCGEMYKETSPEIAFSYIVEHTFNANEIDSAIIKLKNFIIYENDGNLLQESDNDIYKIKGAFKIVYSLDEKFQDEYKKSMSRIDIKNAMTQEEYFKYFENILEEFLDKYEWNYYNYADEVIKNDSDIKNIFNIDFIEADRTTDKLLPETKKFIKAKINQENSLLEIKRNISELMNTNFEPITNEIRTKFAEGQDGIGITKGNNILEPSFKYDAALEEHFHFHLIDKDKKYNLPLDNNGLGYNNLIQIYNILQFKISDDYNILLIEEPEAHLHPAMQYQLFKYLQKLENESSANIKNQIIITSHSSNISASSNIDDIITLHYYRSDKECCVVAENLKGKFISADNSIQKELDVHKKHLVKFLDVTRCDMLFTEKVILVEGLAEKLLIPLFAENETINLVDNHISIVEIGGINFNHFLPLFKDTKSKVLCVKDCDFEYGKEPLANFKLHVQKILDDHSCVGISTIKHITQKNNGSTFENELFIDNFTVAEDDENQDTICKKLLKLVLPEVIVSSELINNLSIQHWIDNISKIKNENTKEKVNKCLTIWNNMYQSTTNSEKQKINTLFFADLFLLYSQKKKGSLALKILVADWNSGLKTPEYIKEGLMWLLK